MEAALSQIKSLIQAAGAEGRANALEALRQLTYSLETPYDVSERLQAACLEVPIAQIGIDLDIFNILERSKEPQTLTQVSNETGAPEVTLSRILRHLAASGMIKESAKDTYASNNITEALASEKIQGLVYHNHHLVLPQYLELPRFLKDTKYVDVTDASNTAFNRAFKTQEPVFEWFPKQTEAFGKWQKSMGPITGGAPKWYHVFPVHREAAAFEGSTVFVDVGGGVGHQVKAIRDENPRLSGRLILQDLKESLDAASDLDGIEAQVHDFFTPQPVKEARFYFMRNILHDYPDEKCVEILQNLKPALAEDSEILINEVVVPDVGAHRATTTGDFLMMTALAARERTKEQWERLLDSAGLKIREVNTYFSSKGYSIIAAVPK